MRVWPERFVLTDNLFNSSHCDPNGEGFLQGRELFAIPILRSHLLSFCAVRLVKLLVRRRFKVHGYCNGTKFCGVFETIL